ncbi:peptide-methionine (S)-S-oxide reductase [Wenzhouxiangella sediminis]|uniref:Peptide methionine sulfoxide reductase MsrA n=2 Tax=Wenzhouxiangella sediminis TaxID=1792836 RepID=A0A3E1KAK5_9GAMM|nr:peptide-methionine (S)-S-oxide reductase [Wenzhouxiangella sediminis]
MALGLTLASGLAVAQSEDGLERATFAGGCFWCMEPPYDKVDGVVETISGFSGGHVVDPSYEQVVRGGTGHLEVVQVVYDPGKVGYEKLLDIYWRNVDPFDGGGQFCDRGESYRPAIFVNGEEQGRLARQSLRDVQARFGQPIEVTIEPFEAFYAAEDYHQDYYDKNPIRYKYYRWRCGRDDRLEEVWGERAGG